MGLAVASATRLLLPIQNDDTEWHVLWAIMLPADSRVPGIVKSTGLYLRVRSQRRVVPFMYSSCVSAVDAKSCTPSLPAFVGSQ